MKRRVELVVLLVSIQYFGYKDTFSMETFFFPSVVKSWFWKAGIEKVTEKVSSFALIIVMSRISFKYMILLLLLYSDVGMFIVVILSFNVSVVVCRLLLMKLVLVLIELRRSLFSPLWSVSPRVLVALFSISSSFEL